MRVVKEVNNDPYAYWHPDMDAFIGKVVTVSRIAYSGTPCIEELKDWYFPIASLEHTTFTGSYAQRQQQWIDFHGLKVGDKVKVVRKFGDISGCTCVAYDMYPGKKKMQGQTTTIEEIQSQAIWLHRPSGDNVDSFPYTALEPIK